MNCTVRIPSPLRAYTAGAPAVPGTGVTVEAVLADLERRFGGIRFRMVDEQNRIRPHMRLYVNTREVTALSQPVGAGDTLHIICALSGG